MTDNQYSLPHHKLIAYGVARELLMAVRAARIGDAGLREQALRAAKAACLNCAEGAGRVSRADKAHDHHPGRLLAARVEAAAPAPSVRVPLVGSAPGAPHCFGIARAEAGEAAAAVEIATDLGGVRPEAAAEVLRLADRTVRLLTGLIR